MRVDDRDRWRAEFIETGHIVRTEEADAAVKASGWAKEFCITACGFWLFGSAAALDRFEEDLW